MGIADGRIQQYREAGAGFAARKRLEILCDAQSSTLWMDPPAAGNCICAAPQSVIILGCIRNAAGEMEIGRRKAV